MGFALAMMIEHPFPEQLQFTFNIPALVFSGNNQTLIVTSTAYLP
jgi:hypothetical protein